MKFQFEIEEFDEMIDDEDFKLEIIEEAKSRMLEYVFNGRYMDGQINVDVSSYVKNLLKERSEEIIDKAVSLIVERAEKKREIKDLIPSSKEISAANKENEKYFMELIDKAIARKFK